MNKLSKIKSKFRWKDNEPDIYNYGNYRMGLTSEEIEEYIIARTNKLNVKKLMKQFYFIAGRNTVAVYTCPDCNKQKTLLYHHDVLRFADVLFGKTESTYFD